MENYNQINNNEMPPQNYMTLSIVATILGCCSPLLIGFILGLVSIFFASQVNSKFYAGNHESAHKNAKYAKTLAFIAIGLAVLNLLYVAYLFTFQPEAYMEQMEMIREAIEEAQANN